MLVVSYVAQPADKHGEKARLAGRGAGGSLLVAHHRIAVAHCKLRGEVDAAAVSLGEEGGGSVRRGPDL